jgi:UMF1 family MFS transporter
LDSTPVDRRAAWAWSLYDFANSAFTTLIVTFIYATYFTEGIAENEIDGTRLWARAVTLTAILVAVMSPYLGAIADRGGYRKRFLFTSTLVCIIATVILFFAGPGEVVKALTWFVIANVAFEMGNVFYNAFLPDISTPDKIGRISGYGWSLGYIGGLLCLVIGYYVLVAPDQPPFGLSAELGEHVRATNLLAAAWFALFSIPIFVIVKERRPAELPRLGALVRSANRQIADTFKEIRQFKDIFWLLFARLIYNDGLVTIFAFGGIYASGTFGFSTADIFLFGIALNLAAGLGAFAFGFVDDRIGGKTTIIISLGILFASSLLAVITTSTALFWLAAIGVGLAAGPNQSASRSLMGRFVPLSKENEFYGFFAFSGKATAFMGPALLGVLTGAFGTQRAGIAVVLVFFVLGAVVLLKVDERRGAARADRAVVIAPPVV